MAHGFSKLLIDEPPLQVLPSLAKVIGLEPALVVQQIHYWLKQSNHRHNDRVWIFNSLEEWLEQFPFFSRRSLQRIFKTLKKRKLLIVEQRPGFDRRNWYSIDYEAFDCLITECEIQPLKKVRPSRQNGANDGAKMARSDSAKMASSDGAKMAPTYTENPENTKEVPAPRLSAGDFNRRLMAYHDTRIVGGIPDGGKQGRAIQKLHDAGFSPEDCEAVYEALRTDKWRKGKVDWAIVRSEIGTRLREIREARDPSQSGADEFGASRPARTFGTPEEFAAATGKPIDEVKANWDGPDQRTTRHAPAA